MDHEHRFEDVWPGLEKQLRETLARRRVSREASEDILQETALRLLRNWSRVRPDSVWAFALTVSLNIVRDEARKRERRDRIVLPSAADPDPEHEAMVRLELDRVRAALSSMNHRQREILLSEIGEGALAEASTPALKMARMRARRRLRALINGASGYVTLGATRARKSLQGADLAIANSAGSFVGRLAAAAVVTAVAVPSFSTPAASTHVPAGASSRESDRGPTEARVPSQGPRIHQQIAPDATQRVPIGSRGDRERRPRRLNQHFGVVHTDGESVWIGDEPQAGPYGVHKTVAQTIGDSEAAITVRVRYDAAECTNAYLERPHAPCADPGSARAGVKVRIGQERARLRVTPDDVN